MNVDVLAASSLSDAFALLAVLTEFPTDELAQGVASGAVIQDMIAICDELELDATTLGSAQDAKGLRRSVAEKETLGELRREYTRLFNHPEQPIVWLYEEQFLFERTAPAAAQPSDRKERERLNALRPRLFVNPASLDALREYRAAGVMPQNEREMPADAMCTQMVFVSMLYQRLAAALLEGDEQQEAAARAAIEEFRRIHLSKWMEPFFEACAKGSRLDIYVAMGRFGAMLAQRVVG